MKLGLYFCNLRTVPCVRHSHIPALQRKVLLRRCRLNNGLTSADDRKYFRRCPPRDSTWESQQSLGDNVQIHDQKSVDEIYCQQPSLETRRFSSVHAHSPRRSRRSLEKISDLDHEGEIQSNHRVDLTQPRALAQHTSVAHISTTFYKSRYFTSFRFCLWTFFSFRFVTWSRYYESTPIERESVNYDRDKRDPFSLYGCNLMDR